MYGYIVANVADYAPRQTSTALSAIAKLQLYNEELVTALLGQSRTHISQYTGVDMANVLSALARMGVQPTAEWAEQWVKRSVFKMRDFSSVSSWGCCLDIGFRPGFGCHMRRVQL